MLKNLSSKIITILFLSMSGFAVSAEDLGINAAFEAAFSTLSQQERMAIQQELKDGGHYSDKIDGAWGPNTLKGLIGANDTYIMSVDPNVVIKYILDGIADGSPFYIG